MKKEIEIESTHLVSNIVGSEDKFLKLIKQHFPVEIYTKGNRIILEGDDDLINKCEKLLTAVIEAVKNRFHLTTYNIIYGIRRVLNNKEINFTDIFSRAIKVALKGKMIIPRTYGQVKYLDYIEKNDIVFAIGPAGTGKTYLAMAMAINYLVNEKVKKIILTRPVVEAGENLGFLPGNLEEKVNPYLKPLHDAIFDMMSYEKYLRYSNTGIIEIAPLAYMRGRTLNDAFIILDEAQNTNPEQMKMFLTRIGVNSKTVITGDITQIDLPFSKKSGLILIQDILQDIEGIKFAYFSSDDVVRHYLVQRIIEAYDKYYKNDK